MKYQIKFRIFYGVPGGTERPLGPPLSKEIEAITFTAAVLEGLNDIEESLRVAKPKLDVPGLAVVLETRLVSES